MICKRAKYIRRHYRGNIPPLIKTDVTIVVHVNLVEEADKSAFWDGESSLLEGQLQLITSNLAIMVSIYRSEEQKKLALSSLNEDTKL